MDLTNPGYLQQGSLRQQKAYKALRELMVFERLAHFNPVLAGTFPIDLVVKGSDLDILCEVHDPEAFKRYVSGYYKKEKGFCINSKKINGIESIIVRFQYGDFPVEIFGQPVAVRDQNAYRHLQVEYFLLQDRLKEARPRLLALKSDGMSTEEAFARLLDMEGDPYKGLILLGRSLGVYD